jgi:hypothetical protein
MLFGYMMVQLITTVTNSATKPAGIGQGARKVDIFNMFAQIPAPSAQLAAECTPVVARTIRTLFNIGIKSPFTICNRILPIITQKHLTHNYDSCTT